MGAQSIYMLILTLDFLRELSMQKGGFLDFNINKYIYMIWLWSAVKYIKCCFPISLFLSLWMFR